MTKTYYRISDLVIEANHQNDLLFSRMHRELKPYCVVKARPPNALIEIVREKKITAVPPKAVCAGYWPEPDEHRYLLDNVVYYRCAGKALFIKNYRKNRLSIRYISLNKRVLRHALAAIKWLIIKCAEDNGYAFVHGAAVHFLGKNIIFAGHSGSGKSSCLLRLNQAEAKIISDDAVLIKGKSLASFFFDLNSKGDLAQRFRFDRIKRWPGISRDTSSGELFQGVDMIFFPHIWNHPVSRLTPVASKKAFKKLIEIYLKETSWNAYPAKQGVCEKRYKVGLTKTRCFDFFAGYREKDARKCLLDFIKHA